MGMLKWDKKADQEEQVGNMKKIASMNKLQQQQ